MSNPLILSQAFLTPGKLLDFGLGVISGYSPRYESVSGTD
jgi:hypothetical protein